MIKIQKYQELGRFKIDWLDAHYHFSFSEYYNPERMGFGNLRVINDDIVRAGGGFGTHPHRDMEIITYVRQGAITHRDSNGNEGRTEAGDVQVMSAGSGIQHSEHNHEDIDTRLYQIWILPREKAVKPRWETAVFPKEEASDGLRLLVSGRAEDEGKGALYIHQDAAIYGGRLGAGVKLLHKVNDKAYVLVSKGKIELNGESLSEGDGAEVTGVPELKFYTKDGAEVIVIEV